MTIQGSIAGTLAALDADLLATFKFQGATRWPDEQIELYVAPAFLDPAECGALVSLIDRNRVPSTVVEGDAAWRTSETCSFDPSEPVVQLLDLRLSMFLGINPVNGEPNQGQRYGVGQEFKLHADYFAAHHDDAITHVSHCGQRTWTAMIYLNEPEEGGETFFHHLDHGFTPELGTMLCWNNLTPEGRPNPRTLHQGKPVLRGAKYVITKWFRQGPWNPA